MRVGTKPGLWTLDTGLDSALDYDLDNGLDYGLNLGRNWTVIVFQLCHVKLAMNARLHNKWRNIKTGIYAAFNKTGWLLSLCSYSVVGPADRQGVAL